MSFLPKGTLENIFTTLEKAGGAAIMHKHAGAEARKQMALFLITLRKQGHSIQADEIFENGDVTGELRIMHMKTCKQCQIERYL